MSKLSETSIPGRVVLTPRAVADVVRPAVLGSYGVTGLRSRGPFGGRFRRLGGRPAIGVEIGPDALAIDLRLSVAYGAPIAEVARQVDSAVRYAVRRALERDIDRLTVFVGALRVDPAAAPPVRAEPAPGPAPAPALADEDDG